MRFKVFYRGYFAIVLKINDGGYPQVFLYQNPNITVKTYFVIRFQLSVKVW